MFRDTEAKQIRYFSGVDRVILVLLLKVVCGGIWWYLELSVRIFSNFNSMMFEDSLKGAIKRDLGGCIQFMQFETGFFHFSYSCVRICYGIPF